MEEYITEAFKKLNLLEDDFNMTVDADKVDELKSFVEDDVDEVPEEPIIDLEAETEEDLEDTYNGKVILECECCHSRVYKDVRDVIIDQESELANVDEECPVCGCALGWTVIGKIEKFSPDELPTEKEDDSVDLRGAQAELETEDEVEEVDESLKENLTDFVEDDFSEEEVDEACEDLDECDLKESLKEGFTEDDDYDWSKAMVPQTNVTYTDLVDEIKQYGIDIVKGSKNLIVDYIKEFYDLPGFGANYIANVIIKNSRNILKMIHESLKEAVSSIRPCSHCGADVDLDDCDTDQYWTNDGDRVVYHICPECGESVEDIQFDESLKEDFKEVEIKSVDDLKKYGDNFYAVKDPRYFNQIIKNGKLFKTENGFKYVSNNKKVKPQYFDNLGDYIKECFGEDLHEDFKEVEIKTDDQKLEMTSDENGKVTVTTEPLAEEEILPPDDIDVEAEPQAEDAEEIVPLTDEEEAEIETNVEDETEEEQVEPDADLETDEGESDEEEVTDVDEESVDEVAESFMKNIYHNVKSYKTTSAYEKGDKLVLEGLITFNSGATKKTSFKFNPELLSNKSVRLIGLNETFSNRNKSFNMRCHIENKKLIAESMRYNYIAKDKLNESVQIKGRSFRKK